MMPNARVRIMSGVRRRVVSARLWLLLATVVLIIGCSFPMVGVARRAPGGGVSAARILSALESDPDLTTQEPESIAYRAPDELYVSCDCGGVSVVVMVDRRPDSVFVFVSDGHDVSDAELPIWTDRVEYVCGRLAAACPEIGAWRNEDNLANPSRAARSAFLAGTGLFLVLLASVPIALIVGGIWLHRRCRRGRAPTSR